MKKISVAAIGIIAMLLALVPTALAACPSAVAVVEGSHVKLTATPAGADYYYYWTHDAALTGVKHSGVGLGDGSIIEFNVPACSGSPWIVSLTMRAKGAPTACKSDCEIPITCSGLCVDCPTIFDPCLIDKPTWCYVCPTAPASLYYEWYTSLDTTTAPDTAITTGTSPTWGANWVADDMCWSPTLDSVAFNVPTELVPIRQTYVTFVVRQDSDSDGAPDKVMKICPKLVTLYWKVTTTVAETVT